MDDYHVEIARGNGIADKFRKYPHGLSPHFSANLGQFEKIAKFYGFFHYTAKSSQKDDFVPFSRKINGGCVLFIFANIFFYYYNFLYKTSIQKEGNK